MNSAPTLDGEPIRWAQRLPLDGLLELSAAVNRSERLEEIYDASIKALCGALGSDRASILLYDQDMVMRFVAWHNLSDEYRAVVEGHSPWTPDTPNPMSIFVDDVREDESLVEYRPVFEKEGLRALGFIPLLYRGRLLGKFMVYYNEPHHFTAQEEQLVVTIANTVAFAIEKRRTEDRLLLYRKIFEHSTHGIAVIDTRGHYIEQNVAHGDLTGFSNEDLAGRTPSIHLGEATFAEVAQELADKGFYRGEVTSTTKDGSRLFLDLSAFAVKDNEGETVCYVGMKRDITSRKMAEEEVRNLNQQLEERVDQRTSELQKAKEDLESFCYSVSHDLRAPLRGMMSAAMMLLEDYSETLDAEGQDHLRRLSQASNRMAQLIDDLLQYSRLGRKEMDCQTVDISAIAERTMEDIKARDASCSHIQFSATACRAVTADPQLMEMVVRNLLENACKFSKEKHDAKITFSCKEEGGRHVFSVRDNGVGFDQKYAEKLFRPFERLHSEARYPGTGIGLANVKRIIDRHGGEVWAVAKVDEGACFSFTLGAEPCANGQ